ncbi:MAG: alpha/beta hydrolase [Thermodesulfobacteriota bacterium]
MVENFLSVLFTGAILTILCVAVAHAWACVYAHHTRQDETLFISARDGWRLAVHRYRPVGARVGLPVILCHGLGGNRYSFDLAGAPSLAQFLKDEGRDVWVIELRGSGLSARPGLLRSDVPLSWGFDDHLDKDTPAAIDFVCARTGAPAIHWIGHSMGGMLGLCHVANTRDARVKSLVTLGSPTDFKKIPRRVFAVLLRLKWMMKIVPFAPMSLFARLSIPVLHRLPPYVQGLLNPRNIEPNVARRIVAVGSPLTMSSRLWLDFGRFLETGVFSRISGEPYLAGLKGCHVPIFSISGAADLLAPPSACHDSDVPGEARLVMGKVSGYQEDYGHMDLLLGSRARIEVYPLLSEWLRRNDDLEAGALQPVAADSPAYGTGTGMPKGPGNGCCTGVRSGNCEAGDTQEGQGS